MIATVADSREFMEERALESFTKQSLVSHSSYNDRMLRMRHGAVDRVFEGCRSNLRMPKCLSNEIIR